ncbi:MAG: tRNA pseudouridine(55) synthase TruB [Planctomycetaceae bacterium]|nr:tRNA pseudouridine(55) synthase TruB [Planctomycetaceae bacterium]
MFGLLNIDKPAGFTSRDIVNRVQRLLRPIKVGHAGTLDPLATGVLLICVGPATRLVPHLHRFPKTYLADFMLGCTSETDDTEGEIRPVADAPVLTEEVIRDALPRFRGTIQQVPPAHSAVKIGGRPAYKRARRGEKLEIQAREVEIHRLELRSMTPQRMTLEIECSSGTYIRSLGRDLASALESGAVMCGLQRTRIGPFAVETAATYQSLTAETLPDLLLPAQLAVDDHSPLTVGAEDVVRLRTGRRISIDGPLPVGHSVAAVDADGKLIALADAVSPGELAPKLVFEAMH